MKVRCTSSVSSGCLRRNIWCLGFALSLLALGAAESAELRFSPSPAVVGQPIVVTFQGEAFACEDQGVLEVVSTFERLIHLQVTPPGCAILPAGFVSYTASVTIGPLAAGTHFITVREGGALHDVATLEVLEAPVCQATSTSLCLGGGRFAVTGQWTDFDARSGPARTAPDKLGGLGDWGVLWFFSEENPEMLVKVLDACTVNGHYWVFLSPASSVKYDVTVRDVRTGTQKVYSNPLGTVPRLTPDTQAFPCS